MPDDSLPANSLLVSTRNSHKVSEIRAILGPDFPVLDLSAVPQMMEVEETGLTFEDNATLKAVAASNSFPGWVIADDSGLEVDALDGAPGVLSARYSGPDATDTSNNELLLKNLSGFPEADRTARFHCVIVLAKNGKKLASFHGTVEGSILTTPHGSGGFGYDPLFVAEGTSLSFAELDRSQKNAISHRSRALALLRAAAPALFEKSV